MKGSGTAHDTIRTSQTDRLMERWELKEFPGVSCSYKVDARRIVWLAMIYRKEIRYKYKRNLVEFFFNFFYRRAR